MSSLAGLVNYSDDDNSSSSDDEQISPIVKVLTKKLEKNVKVKQAVVTNKPALSNAVETASIAPPIPLPPALVRPKELDQHHVRLMAALKAEPIERVENWGIPEEPSIACDPERAERIAHFLSLRTSGHRLNAHLQHNKSFRNPRIYARLLEFAEVDEFGSNFDKQDFDPHGFPKELYIDGILDTQKRLAEEKAASQQNRTSVNFVSQTAVGMSQQPTAALSQQQSSAMAQAMATAAKVASRIAKPPVQEEKRRHNWEEEGRDSKRR